MQLDERVFYALTPFEFDELARRRAWLRYREIDAPTAKIASTIANCHNTTGTPFPEEDFLLAPAPITHKLDPASEAKRKQEMILQQARQMCVMLGGSEIVG